VGNMIKAAGLQTGDQIAYIPIADPDDDDGNKILNVGVNQQNNVTSNENQNQNEPGNVINMNKVSTARVAATTAGGAIAGYLIYKAVVAAATFECFGCGVFFTP